VTPNSDWWDRAKTPPQPETIPVRPRALLATLRKGEHAVTLEKRPVCAVLDWLGGIVVIGEELSSRSMATGAACACLRTWCARIERHDRGHDSSARSGRLGTLTLLSARAVPTRGICRSCASLCVRIVRVNTLSEPIARPDILGNKAQKNAVMMPRRMSPHATSMRTQSIVAASDCKAISI